MKKVFSSFILAGSLTLSNLSAVTAEYLDSEVNIISSISDKSYVKAQNVEHIESMVLALESSYIEFNDKVINYLYNDMQKLVKDKNSIVIGNSLALVARHISNKEKVLKITQSIFKKDGRLITLNVHINKMLKSNKKLQKRIQELIKIAYMGIEAKNTIKYLETVAHTINEDFKIDEYWYDFDINDDEDKALYISSDFISDIEDIDEMYDIESEMTAELNKMNKMTSDMKSEMEINLPKVGAYSFDAINKIFFHRVSFV